MRDFQEKLGNPKAKVFYLRKFKDFKSSLLLFDTILAEPIGERTVEEIIRFVRRESFIVDRVASNTGRALSYAEYYYSMLSGNH